jgi:glycosyltransferase involved in cell wall biosynthesis
VRFEPWLDTEDLVALVKQARIAVLPSFEESFGNTMAEAMALGVPVVSTTAGSIPEVIHHEQSGLLVPPGDVPALAAAIRRVMADAALASRLGEAGRKRALAHFTWDAAAETFEHHYETLLR